MPGGNIPTILDGRVVSCYRRTNKRTTVLETPDNEYDFPSFDQPRLAGDYIGFGSEMFSKDTRQPTEVYVVNARTGRSERRSNGTCLDIATDLELRGDGAVAWIACRGVQKADAAGRMTTLEPDSSNVVPDSLARSSSILYWTKDGAPRSSTLP